MDIDIIIMKIDEMIADAKSMRDKDINPGSEFFVGLLISLIAVKDMIYHS